MVLVRFIKLEHSRSSLLSEQACREFVNRNKACATASKSPELLAKYADGLLKKSNKASEDADLEQSLTDTVR